MAKTVKRPWTYNGVTKWTWGVRYRDGGGKQRFKTCKTKKDADAFRLRIENELEAGTHTLRQLSKTVGAAFTACPLQSGTMVEVDHG